MSFHPYNRAVRAGFSLIEVLVSLFILSLIGVGVFSFQKNTLSLNRTISGNLAAQDEARRAFKSMSAEVRTASPSSLGAYAIAEAATSSLTFHSNIDADALKERVRYFISGATLKKGVIKPSGSPLTYNPANERVSELIHDIRNGTTPIFSYFDTSYDGTTGALPVPVNISAVRLLKINVIIDKNPAIPPEPLTMTTQISIRNLKDNL